MKNGGQEQNEEVNPDRKPDYIAYNVSNSKDGQAFFNRVGAAWAHRDGKGLDVQLESTPVSGRVTLREQREEFFQEEKNKPVKEKFRERSSSHERE